MTTDSMTTDDDLLAWELAEHAGRLLMTLRRASSEGPVLGKAGDRLSNEYLVDALSRRRPGDEVLSEESVDSGARLGSPRVWIIDPLDGTREYSEAGRVDWAVHVALWQEGRLAAGAVALPARDLVLGTAEPRTVRRPGHDGIVVTVSATRTPDVATPVAKALGARLLPMGSAGAKTAAVVLGEADAYLHAGGQHEWDSAAPAAVALAAGLWVSRLDGSDLAYNRPDPYVPDLLVCRPELCGPIQ